MRWMLLVLILPLLVAPAFAQNATPTPPPKPANPSIPSSSENPKEASCGLPHSGTIAASEKYTLNSNCTQTNFLEIITKVKVCVENPEYDPYNPETAYICENTPRDSTVELEIDGQGHTIFNSIDPNDNDFGHQFLVVDDRGVNTFYNTDTTASPKVKVTIKNVTFDGGNRTFRSPVCEYEGDRRTHCDYGYGIAAEGTLKLENVTFTNGGNGKWLDVQGTATLTNVLFENNRIKNKGMSSNTRGVLHVKKTGSATLNNTVFRDIQLAVAVIEKGGSLSTTGCLSFDDILSHRVHYSGLHSGLGTWSDSSTGACVKIQIGNKGKAVGDDPMRLPCGLPKNAAIVEDTEYTLTQDCVCFERLTVNPAVTVTINGNDKSIIGCSGYHYRFADSTYGPVFAIGGEMAHLKIINTTLSGIRVRNFGGNFTFANSKLINTAPTPIMNYGWAHLHDSRFEGNRGYNDGEGTVYYAHSHYGLGQAIFSNNVFSNNGAENEPKIEAYAKGAGAWIVLCGENVREGGPDVELPAFIVNQGSPSFACPDASPSTGPPPPSKECLPEKIEPPERMNLGAIGVIFFLHKCPAVIEIWEVLPNSQGQFALRVSQSDVDAVSEGIVACSSNGRAAVRVGLTEPVRQKIAHSRAYQAVSPRLARDIQFSVGPNPEGKVIHIVADNVLDGQVLGTVDTRSEETPCQGANLSELLTTAAATPEPTAIPFAASVTPQPARADGSIVHVVRPGDTIWQIGIAYDVHPFIIISRNELDRQRNRGGYIFPGQELVIREAD